MRGVSGEAIMILLAERSPSRVGTSIALRGRYAALTICSDFTEMFVQVSTSSTT